VPWIADGHDVIVSVLNVFLVTDVIHVVWRYLCDGVCSRLFRFPEGFSFSNPRNIRMFAVTDLDGGGTLIDFCRSDSNIQPDTSGMFVVQPGQPVQTILKKQPGTWRFVVGAKLDELIIEFQRITTTTWDRPLDLSHISVCFESSDPCDENSPPEGNVYWFSTYKIAAVMSADCKVHGHIWCERIQGTDQLIMDVSKREDPLLIVVLTSWNEILVVDEHAPPGVFQEAHGSEFHTRNLRQITMHLHCMSEVHCMHKDEERICRKKRAIALHRNHLYIFEYGPSNDGSRHWYQYWMEHVYGIQ
jgi:hypothetical protein